MSERTEMQNAQARGWILRTGIRVDSVLEQKLRWPRSSEIQHSPANCLLLVYHFEDLFRLIEREDFYHGTDVVLCRKIKCFLDLIQTASTNTNHRASLIQEILRL